MVFSLRNIEIKKYFLTHQSSRRI